MVSLWTGWPMATVRGITPSEAGIALEEVTEKLDQEQVRFAQAVHNVAAINERLQRKTKGKEAPARGWMDLARKMNPAKAREMELVTAAKEFLEKKNRG